MNWLTKKFHDLTLDELYEILALRQHVFALEQQSIYVDTDGRDQEAIHIFASDQKEIVGCVRLLPPGLAYERAAIGRLVVAQSHRKYGVGKELMKRSVSAIEQLWGRVGITISAQDHLRRFYAQFGFEPVGQTYLEDGIVHIKMEKQ